MPLLGVFQVFDGIAAVTAGVLRARGKQVRCLRLGIFAHLTFAPQFLGALLNLT
jgi:MATE family multidrug resistance protein